MNWTYKIAAAAVAFLLVTVILQPVVANMYEGDGGDRVKPFEEIPGPYRDMDKIVIRLQMDSVDRTDTDGDSLYDAVERIIGTDPFNVDTDYDTIADMDEVMNRTDPMNPDSNRDGLADSQEVWDGVDDNDGDGVPNAWDSDNDGDGVTDSRDMSPYAASTVDWDHHIELNTSGMATTVSLQLRTSDPNTMRLMDQVWDWPYDTEGTVRDLDNSTADVTIVPLMEVTGSYIPQDPEMESYGIVALEDVAYVPVYPIWHEGNIVALQGQMFFPENVSVTSISMDVRLIWKVTGTTDSPKISIKAMNGKYLSLHQDNYIRATASEVGETELFEKVDLDDGRIALLASNGRYLSSFMGSSVSASATNIKDSSMFLMEAQSGGRYSLFRETIQWYYGFDFEELSIGPMGDKYQDWMGFYVEDQGVSTSSLPLAVYPERFALTGVVAQESFGTDVAVAYHNHSLAEAHALNLWMAFNFLRNASNDALDIPGLLRGEDVDVGVMTRTFERLDLALKAIVENMTDTARMNFPNEMDLPIITAIQQRYTVVDLAMMGQGTLADDDLDFDLGAQDLVVRKYLKTTYYNNTGATPVPVEQVMMAMKDWELDPQDLNAVMVMMIAWNMGEDVVVRIGGRVHEVMYPDVVMAVNISLKVFKYGFTAFKTVFTLIDTTGKVIHAVQGMVAAYRAFNAFFKGVKSISALGKGLYLVDNLDNIGHIVGIVKDLSKAWTSVEKIGKGFFGFIQGVNSVFKVLSVVSFIVEIGFAMVTLYCIGSSYEWSAMGTYTAVLYGVMKSIYALTIFVLTLLSFIPKVGIIFTIISTLITMSDLLVMLIFGKGWVQMVMDLIVDLLTNIAVLAPLEVGRESVEVEIDDKDDNGLTAGDRISYVQTMELFTNYSYKLSKDQVNTTFLRPSVKLTVPNYSRSRTGDSVSVDVTWHPWRNERIQDIEAVGWVEPGIGMVNFPVLVWTATEYKTIYEECWWLFGWHCENKYTTEHIYVNPFRIYFDVMPGSIGEFASWRGIRSNDYDGDGIKNSEENRSSPYMWDTDGDGLGDQYELEVGTDPREHDSDHDGLSDKLELQWDYDPHSVDTDGDGLSDYFEHRGWIVSFSYNGRDYDWHRPSDPSKADTDGDGLTDLEEWLTLQNPYSVDTDGDGVDDMLRDYTLTTLEHVTTFNSDPFYAWPYDLAISDEGYVYVANAGFDWFPQHIQKYTSNGTMLTMWGIDGHISDIQALAVDRDGNVYVSDFNNGIIKYDADGNYLATLYTSGPHAVGLANAMDFDEENNIFIFDSPHYGTNQYSVVKVFDRNGTYMYEFGSRGTGEDQFSSWGARIRCAPDGSLLITNPDLRTVQVFERDGAYVRSYDGTGIGMEAFGYITGVEMDGAGDIYISDSQHKRVQKFSKDERWIATFDGNHTKNGTVMSPMDLALGPDDHIYIADQRHEGIVEVYQNVTIVQVDQKVFIDTDGDGLSDEVEDTDWQINVTFDTGPEQLMVTSDPNDPDTDGDDLDDQEEYNLSTNPESMDTDGDVMDDFEELEAGTDPTAFDTDGDTLGDGFEVEWGSDPRSRDTDKEGLDDGKEFELGSDPADNDTDDDGLDDFREFGFDSDLLDADSDDDFMFDSREFELGILPDVEDYDGDGLIDGYEDVFETDAKEGDSDGDELPDGLEVAMNIDPLSNDTDGDGVTDKMELDRGLNPRSGDSDGDGVPDALDQDYELELDGDIYVVVDPRSDTVGFVETLSTKARVHVVSAEELMQSHTRERYIVLVGKALEGEGTAGGITYQLLSDAPDVRTTMNGSEASHVAIRYGKWAPTQTIVMLSRAYHSDPGRVLGILKSMRVKVTDGVLTYTYLNPRPCFKLDQIDTVKATDAIVYTKLEDMATFSVEIAGFDETDTPRRLTTDNGLEEGDVAMGKYVRVEVGQELLDSDMITGTSLWLYYTPDDLDRTGDGDGDDPVDIDETTISMYRFDGDEDRWVRLTPDLDWVEAVEVDTEDLELYGTSYAGFVRADISHLSLFTAAGRMVSDIETTADPGDDITARVGDEVTFDGSGSEGIGGIASYRWTFKHNWQTVTLSGASSVFTFTTPGDYEVTLVVRDTYGGTDSGTMTVHVTPRDFVVRVGPVVDEDSVPVKGARVQVTWAGNVYASSTGFSGMADVILPIEALDGSVTVGVMAEGYEPLEYSSGITSEGTLESQPSSMVASVREPPPQGGAEGPAAWEYAAVIALMALSLLVLLVSVRGPPGQGRGERKVGE